MNKKLTILTCLASAFFCASKAAEPSPTPAPPIVFPQGDFSCIVAVTPHDAPDPSHPERKSGPMLQKVVIARTGNVRCDSFIQSDNSVAQVWTLLDQNVSVEDRMFGQKKSLYVLSGKACNTVRPNMLNFDAESVSWINKENQAKDSAAGASVHYKATITLPMMEGKTRTVEYQAWIDPKTLLPTKFDDGDALYALAFSPKPPTTPLVMPAELHAELDRWKEAMAPHRHL